MSTASKPLRQWIFPVEGDTWERIAKRVFPYAVSVSVVPLLQSWNSHIVYRPCPELLCSDVVFIQASTGD